MIFDTVLDHPSQEVLDYLAKIAAHEGRPDFARLSRAAVIDVAVGRWPNPFPAGVTMVDVPIPRFGGLRTSAYAHIGAAAYELSQGREARAEEMTREVISVGILLGDEAPMLIENLIGHTIARTGGVALKAFYEATGKDADAARIEELDAVATLAADRIPTRAPGGVEAFVRSMPGTVTNAKGLRGLRWESFVLTTTLTPCLNLNRMVFGPDASYEQFIEDAHASLVRWPSEESLFALAQDGYLGGVRNQPAGVIGRFLAISMRSGDGACGPIVSRLKVLSEIFWLKLFVTVLAAS